MGRTDLNVMIGGEAGQGLVTIGDLLVRCLARSGYEVVVTQDYQSRIRGGHNTYVIRTAVGKIEAARESVDLLVALNEETIGLHRDQMTGDGLILGDERFDSAAESQLKVPYPDLAEGRFFNVAALGVAAAVLGLDREVVARALEKAFGKKHPEALEQNLSAVSNAYAWFAGQTGVDLALAPAPERDSRLVMNGNEAIALGALAAGIKFCAFYPMTPSTSVALNLASRAGTLGLVVEQAEDEIAAVNMAIGAAYAGAPSLVPTSGGGFALMVEGVSLAAITETPVLIVVVQRPGPATGLPTRTEQADLEFVLHSGHGEFPRAVFAPGSVEECFHLTARAVDLAERFQGPVFLLSDQYLADSYRAVRPFDLESVPRVDPTAAMRGEIKTPYERYAVTDSGVSPRLLPGMSEHLVVLDSDEHTADGHLTEDLGVRVVQHEKRLKKSEGLLAEVVPPAYRGDDDPDLLLVCWGSTGGPAAEAAAAMTERGTRAACLHFSQVWPLVPDQFMARIHQARRVVSVEGNAGAQLTRLIRRETGYEIPERILRYDGLPLTPEFILRGLDG